LDHSLTLSFLRYARHRAVGRLSARGLEPEWPESSLPVDLVDRVATGAPRAAAESVEAANPYARRLLRALRSYDRIARAGGWPRIPDGEDLSAGSTGTRVTLVRSRLGVPATGPDTEVFDAGLRDAVRAFQKRHGLASTGRVDQFTLAALNVPVEDRIRQIGVNLERARWFPAEFGPRYILVNIPEAVLRVVEGDSVILRMRAVLGKVSRQTPMLADNVTSLVLNPSWNLPPVVIAEDVLASRSGASAYLKEKNITVFSDWGTDAREVDPDSIRWDRVTLEAMPYRLRMEPGPRNALGRVKFLFPNDEHIYIHDSPQRGLFRKDQRFFSSGCVRVEGARDLATYLLRESSRWTEQRVEAAVHSGEETSIALKDPVPVYLVYLTAWVGEEGEVHFRPDPYGRDALIAALSEGDGQALAPASSDGMAEARDNLTPR
jgi:murein L,D-transpeptidase YcbB/YkuD